MLNQNIFIKFQIFSSKGNRCLFFDYQLMKKIHQRKIKNKILFRSQKKCSFKNYLLPSFKPMFIKNKILFQIEFQISSSVIFLKKGTYQYFFQIFIRNTLKNGTKCILTSRLKTKNRFVFLFFLKRIRWFQNSFSQIVFKSKNINIATIAFRCKTRRISDVKRNGRIQMQSNVIQIELVRLP